MSGGLMQLLQSLAPIAMVLMILVALLLLWRIDRSVWLIVAMIAEIVGLLFHGVLFFTPTFAQSTPAFFAVWTLASLVFAGSLLGYAIERTQQHSAR
ncbi:MAG: hypothetical protein ACREPX_10280 [Rhodanobacteraceae bacterium]